MAIGLLLKGNAKVLFYVFAFGRGDVLCAKVERISVGSNLSSPSIKWLLRCRGKLN